MRGLAFISYRREDTGLIAQGLYQQLTARFGPGQVFMDVNSVQIGSQWAERVKDKLSKATVVLAMIGPSWLTASDQWGRRRLDLADDWVHRELRTALELRKPIIPVIVGHEFRVPPPEVLPDGLQGIFQYDGITLRPEVNNWVRDMRSFADELIQYELKDSRPAPRIAPKPLAEKASDPGLEDGELNRALEELLGWELCEDVLAGDHPNSRQELRKDFVFSSFDEAVKFMAYLAPHFSRLNHHPRWSNEWVIVQIRLTTWDAGNKVTKYDVHAARKVEKEHKKFLAQRGAR